MQFDARVSLFDNLNNAVVIFLLNKLVTVFDSCMISTLLEVVCIFSALLGMVSKVIYTNRYLVTDQVMAQINMKLECDIVLTSVGLQKTIFGGEMGKTN